MALLAERAADHAVRESAAAGRRKVCEAGRCGGAIRAVERGESARESMLRLASRRPYWIYLENQNLRAVTAEETRGAQKPEAGHEVGKGAEPAGGVGLGGPKLGDVPRGERVDVVNEVNETTRLSTLAPTGHLIDILV